MADTLAIDPGARLKELGLVLPKPWGSAPGRAQPREVSATGAPAPPVLGRASRRMPNSSASSDGAS